MQNAPVFCPVCSLRVAPADPTRVQKNLNVYHSNCLRKKERKEEEDKRKILTMKAHYA